PVTRPPGAFHADRAVDPRPHPGHRDTGGGHVAGGVRRRVVGIAATDADEGAPLVIAHGLDEATVSALAAAADAIGASTTVGSTTRIPAVEGVPGSSVVLVGLGSPDPEATDETLRRAAGAAARACRGR